MFNGNRFNSNQFNQYHTKIASLSKGRLPISSQLLFDIRVNGKRKIKEKNKVYIFSKILFSFGKEIFLKASRKQEFNRYLDIYSSIRSKYFEDIKCLGIKYFLYSNDIKIYSKKRYIASDLNYLCGNRLFRYNMYIEAESYKKFHEDIYKFINAKKLYKIYNLLDTDGIRNNKFNKNIDIDGEVDNSDILLSLNIGD